jgi:hypothetical protein
VHLGDAGVCLIWRVAHDFGADTLFRRCVIRALIRLPWTVWHLAGCPVVVGRNGRAHHAQRLGEVERAFLGSPHEPGRPSSAIEGRGFGRFDGRAQRRRGCAHDPQVGARVRDG